MRLSCRFQLNFIVWKGVKIKKKLTIDEDPLESVDDTEFIDLHVAIDRVCWLLHLSDIVCYYIDTQI